MFDLVHSKKFANAAIFKLLRKTMERLNTATRRRDA